MIETREAIHLVLEYAAGGSLQQLVTARGRLSEPEVPRDLPLPSGALPLPRPRPRPRPLSQARPLLWQLLDAVAHCHAQHVRPIAVRISR